MNLIEKIHGWLHRNLPQSDIDVELHEGLVLISSADVTLEVHPEYVEVYVDPIRNMHIGKSGFFLSGSRVEGGYAKEYQPTDSVGVFYRFASTPTHSFFFKQNRSGDGEGIRVIVELEVEWLPDEFAERLSFNATFYERGGEIKAQSVRAEDAYRLCMELKKALKRAIGEDWGDYHATAKGV